MKTQYVKIENDFREISKVKGFSFLPFKSNDFDLEFFYDPREKVVIAELNILHGGIQATLLDAAMFWAIYHDRKRLTLLGTLNMKFMKPVLMNNSIKIKAKPSIFRPRVYNAEAWIEVNGAITVKAEGIYIVPKKEDFEKTLDGRKIPEKLIHLFEP
jgi:acyl-coenzyme A thioesterase PaaI-like protein